MAKEFMGKPEKKHVAKSIIGDKDGKSAKLHHIHIEPAHNGFVVKTAHDKPKSKESKGDMDLGGHEEKNEIFNSAEEAAECAHGHMSMHQKHHMSALDKAANLTESASSLEK